MYNLRLIILFLQFFHLQYLFPQKQANTWYFANGIGLDFNVEPPRLLTDGKIFPNDIGDAESAASISDDKGNLLFYTDGVSVWNKNQQTMRNGADLWGSSTTCQTIIIPQPGSANLFYIFTASPQGDDFYFPIEKKGFRYSLADLSLDGGQGVIVEKNVFLVSSNAEKIAATHHANEKDMWVVMHEWKSNVFHSFLVTDQGIQMQSVASAIGTVHNKEVESSRGLIAVDAVGEMKISPNGEKLALALRGSSIVEIFDFDNTTGRLSLAITLNDFAESPIYGVEFSPDSKFLYVSDQIWFIYQINISDPKKQFVRLGNTVPFNGQPTGLQLGPDGKIYVAQYSFPFLGIIHDPNIEGLDCRYEIEGIQTIMSGTTYLCGNGLPNFISSYFLDETLYTPKPFVEMPNVITPNSDNFNERFVPMNYYRVDVARLSVYNRWGQMIFETEDVTKGWDCGDTPPGVYYWALKYLGSNGKEYFQKGFVQVLH